MITISFITANYVARATKYNGVENWGAQEKATMAADSAAYFAGMCKDIAAAGFEAIDIWTAHCHYRDHESGDYLEQVKGICSQFDLAITSYAGGFGGKTAAELERPLRFMKQLGAPMFAGGASGMADDQLLPAINDICQNLGVKYAFENHPQKTAEEIAAKAGNGKFKNIGVALDTGWCGTQGLDALEATKRLRDRLFILHLKDVKAAGGHETCAVGDGVVPAEKIVRFLKQSGWAGNICIEHEPYDRDPMPEVNKSVERVKGWLA